MSAGRDPSQDREITLVVMHPYYPKPVRVAWRVTAEGTVKDIKELLAEEHPWKPPVSAQKIIFHGRYLNDDELVRAVFARWPTDETMTLHLVTGPPPEPAPAPPPEPEPSGGAQASSPDVASLLALNSEDEEDDGNDEDEDDSPLGSFEASVDRRGFGSGGEEPVYPLYEHTQNLGEVATLAGLAGTGVHSAGATNALQQPETVDHARRPPLRAAHEQNPYAQQFHFQQQMLQEMGLDTSLLDWSAFDARQLERALGGGSSALAWFNEEADEDTDRAAAYGSGADLDWAAPSAQTAASRPGGRPSSSRQFLRGARRAEDAPQQSRHADRLDASDEGPNVSDNEDGNDAGDDLSGDELDDENGRWREPQSYQECVESLEYHYKKLMRAIEASQRLQATAAMHFVPMQMADWAAYPQAHRQQRAAAPRARAYGRDAEPATEAEEDAAALWRRARIFAPGGRDAASNNGDAPATSNVPRAEDQMFDSDSEDENDRDDQYREAANLGAAGREVDNEQANNAENAARPGRQRAGDARGQALQRVIVINVQLLVKLGLVVYFLNNDTSSVQFYMMLLGAALVYLYETGYLEPLIGTRDQQLAFFRRQRLHELGHIATADQVPNGLVADAFYFAKAFVLSVIPSWTVVARADPPPAGPEHIGENGLHAGANANEPAVAQAVN